MVALERGIPLQNGDQGTPGAQRFSHRLALGKERPASALDDLEPFVETGQWGGLLLTFLLALVGIVASFPIGVLLALLSLIHI